MQALTDLSSNQMDEFQEVALEKSHLMDRDELATPALHTLTQVGTKDGVSQCSRMGGMSQAAQLDQPSTGASTYYLALLLSLDALLLCY